jgi:hypothetical protein
VFLFYFRRVRTESGRKRGGKIIVITSKFGSHVYEGTRVARGPAWSRETWVRLLRGSRKGFRRGSIPGVAVFCSCLAGLLLELALEPLLSLPKGLYID